MDLVMSYSLDEGKAARAIRMMEDGMCLRAEHLQDVDFVT
jgi:hypothetical protein